MNIFSTHRFGSLVIGLFLVLMGAASKVSAQNNPTTCFQLFFPKVYAQPGDTVCLPLMVHDFEQIVSAQFVMVWNPSELEYIQKDISNSVLPGIMPNSFGPLMANQQIAFAWSTLTGLPISRPDSSILFNLCFRVKSGANGFLPLHITGNSMTLYEVAQSYPPQPTIFLPLAQQIGGISTTLLPVSDLSVSSTCTAAANCNLPVGSASVEVSGGTPPYQYAWTGPNGFTASTDSISGLIGGQYQVVVTDQTGNSVWVEVNVQSAPKTTSVFAQINPAFCGQPNGCAALTVAGPHPPFSIHWSVGGSQATQRCDLSPGLYNVSVTDALGCQSILPITIENDTFIEAPLQWLLIEDCSGSLSANATPVSPNVAYNYLWSTGETSATANGLSEGFYFVTITSAVGACTTVSDVVVQDVSTQSWGLGVQAICDDPGNSPNGNLVLNFNPAGSLSFPAIVSWSDGTTRMVSQPLANGVLDSLLGLFSGNYGLTVTDAAGCYASMESTLNCNTPIPTPEGYPWFYLSDDPTHPDSCVGVFAKNFEGVSALTLSMDWLNDGSVFREIRNLQLPGLNMSNFELFAGQLSMQWQSANPISLPTESLLFEVCLLPSGAQTADWLRFSDSPAAPELVAQGNTLPFMGRNGHLYYQAQAEKSPVICAVAAQSASCSSDNKARIFVASCHPDQLVSQSFTHQDLQGNWQTGIDFSGLMFAEAGSYYIYQQDIAFNSDELFVYVPPALSQPECVWPGDADNNNAVNHHDLLYLGLAFGEQGAARPDASQDWVGQESPDWVQVSEVRQVNYKNIDTNGDGIISASDTLAIAQNWGNVIDPSRNNPFDAPLDGPGGPFSPTISLDTDTLAPGEIIQLPLLVGSQSSPLDSLYGLAFSISYDPKVVKSNIHFVPAASWFGDESQFLWIQKNFVRQGRLDVAITRTDGVAVSGWGAIGNMFIIIEDNIFGDPSPIGPGDTTTTSQLFFSEISSTNRREVSQGLDAPPVELVIRRQTVPVKDLPRLEQRVEISPNPAADNMMVQSVGSSIYRVEISSMEGVLRQVVSMDAPTGQVSLHLGGLPAGTYLARVFCGEGVVSKKLVLRR